MAWTPRDIVFECPCKAEWVPSVTGKTGEMVLTFGVRSYRATRSGEVRLEPKEHWEPPHHPNLYRARDPSTWTYIGAIPAGALRTGLQRALSHARPPPDTPVAFSLQERRGNAPPSSGTGPVRTDRFWWALGETLVLWPASGEAASDRLRFVDILTDSDADGVGDVNERLAGSSPYDGADTPGVSEVDVLPLYDDAVVQAYGDLLFTWIHHEMALANAIFADSGTNVRLRSVGARHVQSNERLRVEDYRSLMEPVGADTVIHYFVEDSPCGGNFACASIPIETHRGFVRPGRVHNSLGRFSALVTTHELGHAIGGLVHSARQGEAYGPFRWSRGHFFGDLVPRVEERGTIMTYAFDDAKIPVFANPKHDCLGLPCGSPRDAAAGADAAGTLDLVRFQIAGWRPTKPDRDGDGFVDPVDALPDDPGDWLDTDGDGRGDNADSDDDNDGVPDAEDAFARDATEWADADGDGVGDNSDADVVDLSPFRDPALRARVEEALGKAPGAPIVDDDLAELTNLSISGAGIRDLTGLELAMNLEELRLRASRISDLRPLSGLMRLRRLDVSSPRNDRAGQIADLSPLSGLEALRWLDADNNAIADLTPLSGLTGLESLSLSGNPIADLSPLSGLTGLRDLSVERSAVRDLSPLSGLTRLIGLRLAENRIAELASLRGLDINELYIGRNKVTLEDIVALPNAVKLTRLGMGNLGLRDISALSQLTNLEILELEYNSVANVAPLAALNGVLGLDLRGNDISDIGPLVQRSIWQREDGITPRLQLSDNPLNEASIREHKPTLESWGVEVWFPDPIPEADLVEIPDRALRALIGQTKAWGFTFVDHPITLQSLDGRLPTLSAFGAGVSDLSGLEAATGLKIALLGANAIVDLTPLEALPLLEIVDLSDNLITDIGPLVNNRALGQHDSVTLGGNPLNEESVNVHIPALLARGVTVSLDSVRLLFAGGGETRTFDTAGYFTAVLGRDIVMEVVAISDPSRADATIRDGILTLQTTAAGGSTAVIVTATDELGTSASLTFDVEAPAISSVPVFPQAAHPVRQGFFRAINRSVRSGTLRIVATDDVGMDREPVTVDVGAAEVLHVNSNDLENGNARKGLSGTIGSGFEAWRLALRSTPNLETLSYVRTKDGFLTAMHDLVPNSGDGYRVVTFNPASNREQVSLLRLANPTSQPATVTVYGMDDEGIIPGRPVTLSLDAGAARTISAQDLESGTGLDGALGDGSGKWRLTVTSDQGIEVASLMESPTGHLTNLSTAANNKSPSEHHETVHHVPLFLSAADPQWRQGFVRIINRGSEDATIRVKAFDSTAGDYDPITLTVEAGKVRHFNSNDLEQGNPAKGLSGGVGSGRGHWRLELESDADVDVLSYVRTEDGFLTAVHDTVPLTDDGYRVATFNPGSNRNQMSELLLVNPGSQDAEVAIRGVDDSGFSPGVGVLVTVSARSSGTYSSVELESGSDRMQGSLGDGVGKWRLWVESDQPLMVMSLLSSPTGHLTNLSTVPNGTGR